MDNRVNSLSGPDITGNEPAKQRVINSPLQINTSLSGPDVYAAAGRVLSDNPVISSASHGVSPGQSPRNLGVGILNVGFHVEGDPDYYFNGSMSEQVMHRYLDRAITINGLCQKNMILAQ